MRAGVKGNSTNIGRGDGYNADNSPSVVGVLDSGVTACVMLGWYQGSGRCG
jgi:hypothetical protein